MKSLRMGLIIKRFVFCIQKVQTGCWWSCVRRGEEVEVEVKEEVEVEGEVKVKVKTEEYLNLNIWTYSMFPWDWRLVVWNFARGIWDLNIWNFFN
jgi:hypothetical protein